MRSLFLAPIGSVLLLSGCSPLATLTAATEPIDLYVLSPKSTFDATLPDVDAQLVIEEPTAASGLNTDRIAIKPNEYLLQYFPKSSWVDRAPLVVQTLLVESFENTGKVGSVGRQAVGLSPDFTLLTDLREFQARVVGGDRNNIIVDVQLNMKIVEEPRGVIIASASFGHQTHADSGELIDVVAAFDDALGQAMKDTVDWAVRELDKAEERRAF